MGLKISPLVLLKDCDILNFRVSIKDSLLEIKDLTDQKPVSQTVVVYTPDYLKHVCPSIRIFEPLREAGFIVIAGSNWTDGNIDVDLSPISKADFVLIARDFPSKCSQYGEIVQHARSLGIPVIYELDDLLVDVPDDHPDVDYFFPVKPGIIQGVLDADAVTVTTPYLRDYLKPFNPRIQVLPNFLIDRFWNLKLPERKKDGPVIIGYMGGHGHKPDLETVEPALEAILDRYGESVELMFWGISPNERLLERKNVHWTHPYLMDYEAFAEYFLSREADIFIAPLQDNVFNRCKSPLKFLEYSAMGIPGVYSNIPPYQDIVKPGETGLLATTTEEWVAALSSLIDDPVLRLEIGKASQEVVKQQFLLNSNAFLWRNAYKNIVSFKGERYQLAEISLAQGYLQNWYKALADKFTKEKTEKNELERQFRELTSHHDSLKTQYAQLSNGYQKLLSDFHDATGYAATVASQLNGILNSRGWKILQGVYNVRLKLAPSGSKREALTRMGFTGISILRREGFEGLLRRAKERSKRQIELGRGPVVENSKVILFSEPGTALTGPAVCIIVRLPEFEDATEKVLNWLTSQTFRSTEVLFWDTVHKTAWKFGEESNKKAADDLRALKALIHGKYVCFASLDLLGQDATYLEVNVIALETEALAFTVNISWDATDLIKKIEAGEFPGSAEAPFFRQVVAKEAIGDDFKLSFAGNSNNGFVAGKILYIETNQSDNIQTWPFAPAQTGFEFVIEDPWVLGKRINVADPFPVRLGIRPVETVFMPEVQKSDKPVIFVLIQFLAVGGAERLLLKLIEGMQDRFTFVVVSMERQALHLGTTADGFRKLTPYVYSLANYLSTPSYFSEVSYLINRFQPVTIYIHNGSNWIYDALGEIRRRFPSIRAVNQVYDHQFGWINRYDPVVVNSLDGHISANTKITQAYVQKGARPDQVFFIEHCIDMKEVDPARYSADQCADIKAKLGVPEGKRIVAFIARLHPQKRPMDFIELARRNESNSDLYFLMVGEGPLSAVVAEYVTKHQPKNLTVHAFFQPITEIYAIMDALVLPSEYEAMPLVVLESQAMGKPVVVTDVGSNRDVVEDTCGGIVVPKIGDIKGLSDGVEMVFKNPIDPVKVRNRIKERFGTEYITSLYEKAFLGK